MKITKIKYYDGAKDKVCRLGISSLFLELQSILLDCQVEVLEKKNANGAAVLREVIDQKFKDVGEWKNRVTGSVDWIKRIRYNNSIVSRLGVEVQVSARSDLLIRDIVHLRNFLQSGEIDVGVIVVPDDRLQYFLPDRTPSYRDAIRYIEDEFKEAMTYPIIVMAIEHDDPGDALPKRARRR